MKLDSRQFDLLALAVFASILAHVSHLPLWLSGVFCIVLGLRWLQRRRFGHWGAVPAWVRLPLTLALPAVVIAEFGNLFGRDPGSVLAVGMLVLKFTESERPRDARAAVTFGCFVLMAALLFDQALAMSVLITIGLLPQIMVLRSLEPSGDDPATPLATRDELRRGLPYAALNVLIATPLALLAFLFLPRLAEPLWGAPSPERGKTGMSDTMTPGALTELLIDDSPAFRASFANGTPPPPAQLYWRGLVLWRFDGTTWSHLPSASLSDEDTGFRILSEPLAYQLTMEPTQQTWVFALDLPVAAPPDTRRNSDFSIISEKPIASLTQYKLSSATIYRQDTLTRRQRTLGLSLPPGYNPRTIALAQQWRERYGDDERRIVDAALAMYAADFSYSLSAPKLGRNSMDDFLFDTQLGYCEHFASSFTVLMRAAGIPARVVVGYQGGYWNTLGNYMVVRQSDAHAWSEIWREGTGWVRVDPTAAVRPERVDRGGRAANAEDSPWYRPEWLLALRNRWDLVNQLWNRAVVQFNALQQKNLLSSLGMEKADWLHLALALTAGGGLLVMLAMWWALRRDRDDGDAVDRAYRRLGRRLARAGLARGSAEGPEDYLARLRAHFPQAATDIENVFARYVALRYASRDPSPEAVREFQRAVAALRVRTA